MSSCMNGGGSGGGEKSSNNTMPAGSNGLRQADSGQGCYLGCFGSSQNAFCEVNYSGHKPNVVELAQEEPSCGLWSGCFCRQVKSQEKKRLSAAKPGRSHLHVDGGGWFKTHKQRTTFLLVVQDEVVKGPTTTTAAPKTNNRKALPAPTSTAGSQKRLGNNGTTSGIVPRTIRASVSRITSKSNHSAVSMASSLSS